MARDRVAVGERGALNGRVADAEELRLAVPGEEDRPTPVELARARLGRRFPALLLDVAAHADLDDVAADVPARGMKADQCRRAGGGDGRCEHRREEDQLSHRLPSLSAQRLPPGAEEPVVAAGAARSPPARSWRRTRGWGCRW